MGRADGAVTSSLLSPPITPAHIHRYKHALAPTHPPTHPHAHTGLPPGHPELRSYLSVPIYMGGTVIGSVNLGNGKDGWSHDLIPPLQTFATLLGGIMIMFEHRDGYVWLSVGYCGFGGKFPPLQTLATLFGGGGGGGGLNTSMKRKGYVLNRMVKFS